MYRYLTYAMLCWAMGAGMDLAEVKAADIEVEQISELNLSGDDIIEVEPNTLKGFNFPYFLFVPAEVDKGMKLHLLVEVNNTGTATDDFEVHRRKARDLVGRSYPNRMARELRVPLLVPVFPRLRSNWRVYTHALDRDSLEINEGELKRIDRQLLAMIDHAIELLRVNGFKMHDKIFMHGFSASAKFCNRFAFLYPKRVQAAAAGGVNGLPTLPISERNGHTLPFPIGIADIETFTGKPYEEQAHKNVAQYIYMGYLDRNDTLPSRDAWREEEAEIIQKAIAAKMMPDRWQISRDIYKEKLPRAQCVTYNGVGHGIKNEMRNDLVKFFRANSGNSYAAIEPHSYPFVEYRYIREAHVNAVYYEGDKDLPVPVERVREGMFLISIEEWLAGQDHRQLSEFVENAGFNFRLCAEGHPDIIINRNNYNGNRSSVGGERQFVAFYMQLSESQLKVLEPDVPYTLHSENKSDKYFWTVNDGVTLVRPIPYHDIVVAQLDSTILPTIEINAGIQGAVMLLNRSDVIVDCAGIPEKINFQLRAKPEEIAKAPNIQFSAKGLSVMELLLIICRRASLEYRIEGTTVYIENNSDASS